MVRTTKMAVIPTPSIHATTTTLYSPPPPLPSSNPTILLRYHCRDIPTLRQLHSLVLKSSSSSYNKSILSAALLESAALSVPGALPYALRLFCLGPHTPKSYSILIRAYIKFGSPYDALHLFVDMLDKNIPPDGHIFSCVLKSCSRLDSLRHGKEVHSLVIKSGYGVGTGKPDLFVRHSLVHMYASCGDVDAARAVFERIEKKVTVTWNAMLAGYFKNGNWGEVVELFRKMVEVGEPFDVVTLVSVLMAGGRVGERELGEWIRGYMEENGLMGNRNLVTALVDMYAKCGEVEKARQIFDEMPRKDVVAWSAMVSGYAQADRCKEALALFSAMQSAEVEPNEVTMVSVLSACAALGALEAGKWVHSYVRRKQLPLTLNLGTALVDFYSKCGCIEDATEVFEAMPERNTLMWTVLIMGMANNGRGRKALELFSTMVEANFKPMDVTFLAVLLACSHSGLVEEGHWYFDSMRRDYGIEPRIEHYGCMVDLLGRAGLIQEAYEFVRTMPIEPNAVVWRTLLSACKVHKNVEIGEESLKEIVKLEPRHSGDYILLSNIYASVGRWEDAVAVRNLLKEMGIKKTPGCTLIEMDGTVFEFFAEDCNHAESTEIYAKVDEMLAEIMVAGYVPNTADVRLDVKDDEKEVSIKLAIAFGLMKSAPGATIRLSTNLRVSTDFHLAMKVISKVYNREIVVRGRNRFHHFKDGYCSCNDYW